MFDYAITGTRKVLVFFIFRFNDIFENEKHKTATKKAN
jgi:hypothetical protein